MSTTITTNSVDVAKRSDHALGSKETSPANYMALAFLYLVKASISTSETALIKAKQIGGNARAQAQLIKQENAMQFRTVPTLNNKTITEHDKHTNFGRVLHGKDPFYTTVKHIKPNNYVGVNTVNRAQAQNRQVDADRALLSQKIGILRQSGSVNETNINSINDDATQTMQEGTKLETILQSETFNALMRRPPRT